MKNTASTINMCVNNDNDFLSTYSLDGNPVISSEVASFLENSAKQFHPKEELTLNIYSNCIDEKEKELYKKAIKNYFDLQIKSCDFDLKRKSIVGITFSLIGIIALAIMFIFSSLNIKQIWIECINIFAWVFVWEGVDQLFIERGILLFQRKRLISFLNMDINFFNKN